jgi:hypothetical protein
MLDRTERPLASPRTAPRHRQIPIRSLPCDSRRRFALAVWTAAILVAVVLVSRRGAGVFNDRGSTVALPCAVATLVALATSLAHLVWSAARQPRCSTAWPVELLGWGVTVLPPLACGMATWIVPSALVGGYLTALFAAGSLLSALLRDAQPPSAFFSQPTAKRGAWNPTMAAPQPLDEQDLPPAQTSHVGEESPETCEARELEDASFCQSMTRRIAADGHETVEGALRIAFGPGETTAIAHVAFVPPLAGRPHVECHMLSDFEGRVRIAAAQPFGLRIEARRADGGRPAEVDVAFTAAFSAGQVQAA